MPPIPEPTLPAIGERYNVLVAGIGGSGVVTISQTLAVAAYLDGLFSSNLDLTGLSQKYGAVAAHVRIATKPDALHATRIASGEADALIGCDLIVAAGDECVSKLNPRSRAVISADLTPTAEFARNPNWSVDADGLIERLTSALGDRAFVLDAQRLAEDLLGDPIASNMFMLGAACARLERNHGAGHARRFGRAEQRIDADRPGEPIDRALAGIFHGSIERTAPRFIGGCASRAPWAARRRPSDPLRCPLGG